MRPKSRADRRSRSEYGGRLPSPSEEPDVGRPHAESIGRALCGAPASGLKRPGRALHRMGTFAVETRP